MFLLRYWANSLPLTSPWISTWGCSKPAGGSCAYMEQTLASENSPWAEDQQNMWDSILRAYMVPGACTSPRQRGEFCPEWMISILQKGKRIHLVHWYKMGIMLPSLGKGVKVDNMRLNKFSQHFRLCPVKWTYSRKWTACIKWSILLQLYTAFLELQVKGIQHFTDIKTLLCS